MHNILRIFTYLDQYSFEEAALLISHLAHTNQKNEHSCIYTVIKFTGNSRPISHA